MTDAGGGKKGKKKTMTEKSGAKKPVYVEGARLREEKRAA